jgi:acetylornithine deacetylase
MTHEQIIAQWLHEHSSQGIKMLQMLIQEPSRRYHEGTAQAIVVEKCRELGLDIDLWEIGDQSLKNHPHFHSDRNDFSSSPNLVAVKKGSGGGRSLILNSHIDVVPEGNIEDWEDEPYSGMIKDGKVYGRGATDMKGGTVALLLAIEAIIKTNISLKGDLIFQSVIEEESGGTGTLAAILRGYQADGAIIPEPTNMKLFPWQQGSIWFRINVKGKSAHGGTRYEGVSAIEQAMTVIEAIQKLEKHRNEIHQHDLYKHLPIPIPINIGKISGGNWPSSVPDSVIMEGRLGIAPTESVEAAQQSLRNCLTELQETNEWLRTNPVELEWFGARWLPGNMELDHPLLQVMQEPYKKVVHENPIIEASPWGTDGGYLSGVGHIPTIVFGPGKTELAHEANEYIEIEKIKQAAHIIALTVLNWCGCDEER